MLSDTLTALLLRPAVVVPALCALVYVCVLLLKWRRRGPRLPNIPIMGARKGDWFPILQAQWRNTRDFKTVMEQAHAQYKDEAVLVPVASSPPLVMLPHHEVDFMMQQPDSVLGFNERAFELYQVDYTFVDPSVPRATLHEALLRTALTPRIGTLVPALADEVAWAFDKHWGTNTTEWQELCVFETMRHIVGGVANRAFVGLPFCQNPELVNSGMAFAVDIPLSGALMNLFWAPLRPLVAPLITLPNRIHTRAFRRLITGEIKRRLKDYDARQAMSPDEAKSLPVEPSDLLQWSIHQAKSNGNPFLWRAETLADRILIVNFAAIHTTSFTSTWAMFDLVASIPQGTVDILREEIKSVLAANGGAWTKKALAQLVKLESAMRESARLSSILAVGLGRVVVAEEGLTTPSGVHLDKGQHVAAPVYAVMLDDHVYEDAATFKPFRFCSAATEGGGQGQRQNYVPLTTTGPDFLAFGHGKHACPGRYFAAAELKLILAYALLHYEFEILPVKPEGPWYGLNRIPPLTATIRVRRRTNV
ncbi:putative cytochrome P450 [Xylaria longipes]|nr:putative cytochrome P450 [Xylaria longipes]